MAYSPPPQPVIPIEVECEDIPMDAVIETTKWTLETYKKLILIILSTGLSEDAVKDMLKKYAFFDYVRNKEGRGFDNQFELQKNGQVVYDKASDLMWQQSGSSEAMTFEKAKKWADELDYAGFQDWRLPTLEEAMSLMEPTKKGDLYMSYIDPIFDKTQERIWTADLVEGQSWAWVVYFGDGYCSNNRFSNHLSYVRAVRSGQSSVR